MSLHLSSRAVISWMYSSFIAVAPFKRQNICSEIIILKTLYNLEIEICICKYFQFYYNKEFSQNLPNCGGV